MSKVTKTILILQSDSWIAAHSGASCCALSTSSLPAFSPLPPWNKRVRAVISPRSCVTTLNTAALFPPSRASRWTSCDLETVPFRPAGSGLLTERGVWVPRPAVPDCSSSLNRGRISVLSCCPNSQWLHFIQTLAWSHSNQEDPASLCWAGKRRQGRGNKKKREDWLIWMFGGGVWLTACRELPGSNTHPGAWSCQMLFRSASTN